jgi:hypothetical protein
MGSYGAYWDYRYTSLIKKGSIVEYVQKNQSLNHETARALGIVLNIHRHPRWSYTTYDLICQSGKQKRIRIWQIWWIHKV